MASKKSKVANVQEMNAQIEQQNQQTILESKTVVRDLIRQHAQAICEDLSGHLLQMKVQYRKDMDTLTSSAFQKMNKAMTEALFDITKQMKSYSDKVDGIKKVIEDAEDTLCNVLLAIRQNEYLQAWYPEQHGQPEQKVVGTHPNHAKKR